MGGRRSVTHLLSRAVLGAAALLITGLMTLSLVGPAGALTPSADQTGHVTADVAETYVPLTPSRITDTRAGSGYPNAGSTLGAGGSLNVQVTGAGAVPTTGVTAVVVNVTVVGPTASSYLTVFPEGTTQPGVSNVNFTPGQTLANLATVPLGSQGGITVYNYTGSVNVVVDVEGYYTTTPQTSGLYNPVNPLRVLGTLAGGASIGPGASTAVTVAGVDGVPADASAVVANVTVAGSSGPGFLTVFPAPEIWCANPTNRLQRELHHRAGHRQSRHNSRRSERSDRGVQQQRLGEGRRGPERLLHGVFRRTGQCLHPNEPGSSHGHSNRD